MTSLRYNFGRLGRFMTLGFRGSRARQMKLLVICQWVTFLLFMYMWYKFNGGFLPSFLRSRRGPYQSVALDINLVDHFLSAQHDGSLITWAHAANDRNALRQALTADHVMMIEADILLRGQNTIHQEMTPIMARLPNTNSDLTLAEWLMLAKGRGKGLKLDFKSIEAVEISLQKLGDYKDELNAPLHLSAAILEADEAQNSFERTIDPNRFLRLVMTHAADCTVALGWISGAAARRYNWTAVKNMYDVIDRWHIKQPITFNVKAQLARRSLSQIKWLMELTPGSTLTVISSSQLPDVKPSDLADLTYIRRRLPRHSVFYDVPRSVHVEFNAVKDESGREHPDAVELDEARSFVADQWKVVRSRDGETIYLGTGAVLLQTGVLITKAEYPATPQRPVVIMGRVEFLDDTTPTKSNDNKVNDGGNRQDQVGLAIFLRASQSSRPDSLSGIRCFLGVTGHIRVEVRRIPGASAERTADLPGTAPCFGFRIIDNGVAGISVRVTRPKLCDTDFNVADNIDFEASIELPMKDIVTDEAFIAIKQSVPIGFTAVDQFTIHTKQTKIG